MSKTAGCYSRLIAAALILSLLSVFGCAKSSAVTVDEDNSFTHYQEYTDYFDNDILDNALEAAGKLGNSWYGDGESSADIDEYSWLLDYSISAHTKDGRGVIVIHVPGSAGMSQEDFVLLTTKDYGKTWASGGGVYHIAGGVSQITISEDHIYLIVDSEINGNSYVLMSEDFGGTFRVIYADNITPAEYQTRMSDLYGVYMRIINVESDNRIVLKYFCNRYTDDFGSDGFQAYDSSVMSDEERAVLILHSDAHFSEVNTLYADKSFW